MVGAKTVRGNSKLTNDATADQNFYDKISFLQEVIRNTILSIKNNKIKDIFSNNDAILSVSLLTDLYESSQILTKMEAITKNDHGKRTELLKKITEKLLMVVSGFGTKNMDDLLSLCLDTKSPAPHRKESELITAKIELIRKYVQPIGCKIIPWKPGHGSGGIRSAIDIESVITCDKITENICKIEDANAYECFDIDKSARSLYHKIFGIRVVVHDPSAKKTVIVSGIVEDIQLDCFTNAYITSRKNDILNLALEYDRQEKDIVARLYESFTLKDILVYGTGDVHKKMVACITEINNIKQTKLEITIKKFLDMEELSQRNMLINLLIYHQDDEVQYLCYILYDLISSGGSDTNAAAYGLLDSLPWKIKRFFKDIVKCTTKCTNDMMQKYDVHKITMEQQIYLMKANDIVKEKAIMKLKEVKSRSDESGQKAKQYLEALLKIPFHVYKEEPALKRLKDINKHFLKMLFVIEQIFDGALGVTPQKKDRYTLIELIYFIRHIENLLTPQHLFNVIRNTVQKQPTKQVLNIIYHINTMRRSKKQKKIATTNRCKGDYITSIIEHLQENKDSKIVVSDIFDTIHTEIPYSINKVFNDLSTIKTNVGAVESSVAKIEEVLDASIYGHQHAKNQIMKIIAQWMNGEQTGYCFGFEGCPGIGKTSLAKKGLSNCLTDENGSPRPFAFIAIGGSSNGSLLDGHGYTYMNSSWGKIVDILIETKCMNPIIYIDELDKVSKTEQGREIIGILTHLIDPTQNDKFQDKYFSGIDIDLSKALFIFSYNDPDQIDKILLDRIHRIKFDNLTVKDKIIICRRFILPEINKKMGFENIVELSDETIEYIVLNYTLEPGVRKLKELFFDLFGEINLSMLKSGSDSMPDYHIPINITAENIGKKYLLKYNKITEKKIHDDAQVGIINGLWANALGKGGIIPIQARFFPSSTFLELKLTGLQGDVMKESMNVAKTLAWSLTPRDIKKEWVRLFDETREQGLHIHCPEGGISKDGPSAGAAITVALYSLFNAKPIIHDLAITGEICLNGDISAIGGLEHKINGGIRAGIKTFLYPKANHREFDEWAKKDNNLIECGDKIRFIEVSAIHEVFEVALC